MSCASHDIDVVYGHNYLALQNAGVGRIIGAVHGMPWTVPEKRCRKDTSRTGHQVPRVGQLARRVLPMKPMSITRAVLAVVAVLATTAAPRTVLAQEGSAGTDH